MKVWVDLTNPAHVVVLRPLIELLEAGVHEVTLTARPLSHTTELLDDWGHPYTAIGHHGGAGKLGKALRQDRGSCRRSRSRAAGCCSPCFSCPRR